MSHLGATLMCLILYPLSGAFVVWARWFVQKWTYGERAPWDRVYTLIATAAALSMSGLGALMIWAYGWWPW